MEKPKKWNTENSAKYLEFLTDGQITVKEYRKNGTSILYCNKCNHEIKYRLSDFIRYIQKDNKIRHKCNNSNFKVNEENFLRRVSEQEDIEKEEYSFIGKYIDYNTKIKCRHNKCNHEWDVLPRHFTGTMKTRCPKCSKKKSKYEELINNYLTNLGIIFIREYNNSILNNKSFDFALMENNSIIGLIEFDGEQHDKLKFNMTEKEFELQKLSDKFKDNYALENKIPLIRIKYKDRNKYKSIIDNFLKEIASSTTIETTSDKDGRE